MGVTSTYLEDVKETIRASEEQKTDQLIKWQTSIAFFKGHHYSNYSNLLGLIPTRKREKWRVQLTVNFYRRFALTMIAKLTQNRPAWNVRPATRDQDDRDKARMAQALLDYVWEEEDCQSKLADTAADLVLCGEGYWGVYWNRTAGSPFVLQDPETRETIREGVTGFLQFDSIMPFDIGLDPIAPTAATAEWGYRLRCASKDWVKRTFAKTVKGNSDAGDDELQHRLLSAKILEDVGTASRLGKNYTTVIEWYDCAKRKFVTFCPAEGVVLDQGEWTLPIPYLQARAIPNKGDLEPGGIGSNANRGESPMWDALELNKQLNRRASQLTEIANLIAFPRILAHKNAKINPATLVDEPGSVIEFSGATLPPQPFHLGSLPGWVAQMPAVLVDWMRDMTGIHPISQGSAVGSIQSGRGMGIIAEQEQTNFAPMARSLSRLVKQAGAMGLKLWKTYADGPFTVKVVGKNTGLEVYEFFASDISSTDVVVQEGSTFASNKALRTDQLFQLWNYGIIKDDRQMRKMLEFGEVEEAAGDIDLHRLKQRREIEAIIAKPSEPQPVQEWHDSYIHLDEMTGFLNSTTFDNLPDAAQAGLVAHYQAHLQREQVRMQQQQMAAMQRGIAAAGSAKTEVYGQPPMMAGGPTMGLNPGAEAFPAAGAGTITEGGVRG
jgi:hypothetical protein